MRPTLSIRSRNASNPCPKPWVPVMRRPTLSPKHPEQIMRRGPSSVIPAMLRNALGLHRAGRLPEAEQLYRQILAIDPHHADSLHLLGMIDYQAGDFDAAIGMIRRAIAINPNQAAYHSNLGTIFHAQGDMDEACRCYARAVALEPSLAQAHYNLGNALHSNAGNNAEKLDQAAACYEQALRLQPNLVEAHYNLGNLRQDQGRLDDAMKCYERTLAIDPKKYDALQNLGNALKAQDKLEEAQTSYERALAIEPGYAKAHFGLGSVFHALGKLDEAISQYRIALSIDSEFAEPALAEALARLQQGEFETGWRGYERRWQTKEHTPPMRTYSQPLWNGEKLSTGRLLIWGEQGIGDEIMFAGLIPEVVGSGNHCVLDCDARLQSLFARSFPDVEVVSGRAKGDDPGHNPELHIAAHLPSGSLPGIFRANSAAFAATQSPYLVADPDARQRFRTRYADGRRLVGLAWYTNNRRTGRIRSIDLSEFAPLFERKDIRWISLQYGDPDTLESQAAQAGTSLLIDPSVNPFTDVDLFAAQIAAMDMVITIDNSTAHFAGALGIPTWVLLPFASDWRWLQDREDSPWYPSLRLFRQSSRGDWQFVLQAVKTALRAAAPAVS